MGSTKDAKGGLRVLTLGVTETHAPANLLPEAGPGEMQHKCYTNTLWIQFVWNPNGPLDRQHVLPSGALPVLLQLFL